MIYLRPHHRIHIPNGLAIIAALLLVASSIKGFDSGKEQYTGTPENIAATNVETPVSQAEGAIVKPKSRGINLGLLLFRR